MKRLGPCDNWRVNFLAHCFLADRHAPGDDGLLLGGMLGDFIRGRDAMAKLPDGIQQGILLHRHIDRVTDSAEPVSKFRHEFPTEFRRFAGIIMDVGFDHCLANNWNSWSDQSLESFDEQIREMLDRQARWVSEPLARFMAYADIRGLFTNYGDTEELLFTLTNMGRRVSRANPLHRVNEIWDEIHPGMCHLFHEWFPELNEAVAQWVTENRARQTGGGNKNAA